MGDEVQMHHATLKLGGVPVFYAPYAEHPTDFGRKSGFLIPEIGESSTPRLYPGRCVLLGHQPQCRCHPWSCLVLIARLGSVWRRARHWLHLRFAIRILRGNRSTKVRPAAVRTRAVRKSRLNGWKNFAHGFRGAVSVDYLSSYLFRLAFAQGFTEAINSEVRSYGFLSKELGWVWPGLSGFALSELSEHGARRFHRD